MIAYLDCWTGVSGDKLLAALVDAGANEDELRRGLSALPVGGFSVRFDRAVLGGISARRAVVDVQSGQPFRRWADLRAMLEAAPLPERARTRALTAFSLLAEAEARVHAVPVADVHFHEVGAVDSVVDVVGVALALELLGVEEVVSSPVALGHGTVETAHGTLPVPAPATAELVRGLPAYGGDVAGELTTPTGAALVRALASSFGTMPAMVAETVGYGGGSRDLPVPNVLRVTLGRRTAAERGGPLPSDEVELLETNVDHLPPEHLAAALERVAALGALDVWQTPVVMKKGRLGTLVGVLAEPSRADDLAAALLRETGTLGVRRSTLRRTVAERWSETVDTSLGCVRVKVWREGERTLVRAEADDAARVADSSGLPVPEVARLLAEEAGRLLDAEPYGTE